MLSILTITAPIFLLIGVGWFAAKRDIIKPEAVPSLGAVILYICIPAMLFNAIRKLDLSADINVAFMSIYAATGLILLILSLLCFRLLSNHPSDAAIKTLGIVTPNTIFIGFPMLMQSFDDDMTVAMVMAVAVENLVLMPILLSIVEISQTQNKSGFSSWLSSVKRVASNPIILAIGAGVAANLMAMPLPAFIEQSLDILSRASAALALLYIGATLALANTKATFYPGVFVGKLIVHPALVLTMIALFPALDGDLKRALLIICAAPMFSIYPVLAGKYGYGANTSYTLLITTVTSFFTLTVISFWWN